MLSPGPQGTGHEGSISHFPRPLHLTYTRYAEVMAEFPTTLGTFSPSFSSETLQAVGDDLPVVCWSVQWHMRFG